MSKPQPNNNLTRVGFYMIIGLVNIFAPYPSPSPKPNAYYRVIDNDWYFLFLYYSGYKSLWDLLRVSKFQWLGSILILGFQKIKMDCHNFQHLVCLAPWICKNRPKYTLFFNILTYRSRNNLILVPTPHNILGIMGGRDKN